MSKILRIRTLGPTPTSISLQVHCAKYSRKQHANRISEQTIDGQADKWGDKDDNNLFGNLKQFYLLKRENRHLKVSLSVGGWSWSANFSTVAADPKKRAVFSQSAATLVQDLALDGIGKYW